jgi:hypothetical protein
MDPKQFGALWATDHAIWELPSPWLSFLGAPSFLIHLVIGSASVDPKRP